METLVVERRISAGIDDVEEAASGAIYFDSSDLELVDDSDFNGVGQTVGLRFSSLGIPQGAIITGAYLQFQVDQADSGAIALEIRGQNADNAGVFTATSGDVSSRATTSAAVSWSPAAWTNVGASGLEQRTPDLTELVQQIVSRSGWSADNALAFIVTGSGERSAISYDGDPDAAPLLHIEYVLPDSGNRAPIANDDTAATQAGVPIVIAVLGNDGDPDGDDYLITSVSDPANGQININFDGTITYTPDAGFSGTDSFTYTLTDTGNLSDSATVDLTVTPTSSDPLVVERRIASGTDDVEEAPSGAVYFGSSDLELVDDSDFNGVGQTVGLRFSSLGIPQGAIITGAYLQFQVDQADSGAIALEIRGQNADNAGAFTATSGDVSSRATTSAAVSWSPAAWTNVGASGLEQRTPDLTELVQQIVSRSGWSADNALAFIVTGTGERSAISYDGDPDAAPLLHIEYVLPDSGNRAPIANDDTAATQAGVPIVIAVLGNDGDPDGDDYLITSVSDPANGQININFDGTITYTPDAGFSGTDSFTYTLTDTGDLSDSATVDLTVTPTSSDPLVVERRIASGTDDVEEAPSGAVYFGSSDLELVDDSDFNGVGQTVGLRFSSLGIPQGAIITGAYLQFQVDQADSGTIALEIRGQSADDAGAFTATSGDVSSRATTSAAVSWSPAAWTNVGASGLEQRTPDLTELVQQIVSRSGWSADNALAFIVTGTGERSAISYDGDPDAAPLLHIEYVLPDPNNQAPTGIILSDIRMITENEAGAIAGTLDVIDADQAGGHSYTVSDDRFEVLNNQLKLKDDARLDFEKGAEVSLEVTAVDSAGTRITENFTLSLEDVPETRFAALGDYAYGQAEQEVADLIDGLNVDFIITTGDNAYDDVPIDDNIGRYFADYIGNYQGNYGPGSAVNRFFPSLGNHEYHDDSAGLNDGIDIYLDYFTLPGNERYYEFEAGPVHFFALNSYFAEPDGIDSASVQAAWLQSALAASTAPYKIVYFHHPAYSSGPHGNEPIMQWPFEQWGATAVLNGHDHTYERILRDDNGDGVALPYLVTGLGGRIISEFSADPAEGSTVRYNDAHGTMLVQASDTSITFEFISLADGGTVIDSYTIDLPTPSPAQALTRDTFEFQDDVPAEMEQAAFVPLQTPAVTASLELSQAPEPAVTEPFSLMEKMDSLENEYGFL